MLGGAPGTAATVAAASILVAEGGTVALGWGAACYALLSALWVLADGARAWWSLRGRLPIVPWRPNLLFRVYPTSKRNLLDRVSRRMDSSANAATAADATKPGSRIRPPRAFGAVVGTCPFAHVGGASLANAALKSQPVKAPLYRAFEPFAGGGIFTAEGEAWHARRTEVLAAFAAAGLEPLAAASIQNAGDTTREMRAMMAKETDDVNKEDFATISLLPLLQRATLRTTFQYLAGLTAAEAAAAFPGGRAGGRGETTLGARAGGRVPGGGDRAEAPHTGEGEECLDAQRLGVPRVAGGEAGGAKRSKSAEASGARRARRAARLAARRARRGPRARRPRRRRGRARRRGNDQRRESERANDAGKHRGKARHVSPSSDALGRVHGRRRFRLAIARGSRSGWRFEARKRFAKQKNTPRAPGRGRDASLRGARHAVRDAVLGAPAARRRAGDPERSARPFVARGRRRRARRRGAEKRRAPAPTEPRQNRLRRASPLVPA